MHHSIATSPLLRNGILLLMGHAFLPGAAHAQTLSFDVFGRTHSSWGSVSQQSQFNARYAGEAEFRFDTASRADGPNGDNYANAQSRYNLNLLGGSFGVGAELSEDFGPAQQVQATASSFAQSVYRMPGNGVNLLNLTKIQAIIPIHGRIGLYDGEGVADGMLTADVDWSYSLINQTDNTQLYEGDGSLRFESTYGGSGPDVVQRTGLFAFESNLDITSFDDGANPLVGHNILSGYEIDGFAIATAPIEDVAQMDYFRVNFQLSTSLTAAQDYFGYRYGKSDFFNSASIELRGLDADDNVIEGLVFEPVTSVPEPGGLVCLSALGVLSVRMRRRR